MIACVISLAPVGPPLASLNSSICAFILESFAPLKTLGLFGNH